MHLQADRDNRSICIGAKLTTEIHWLGEDMNIRHTQVSKYPKAIVQTLITL